MDPTNFLNYYSQIFLSRVSNINWLEIWAVSKIVFFLMSLFFLGVIIYCLSYSSWINLRFWQDLVEIISYRAYGIKKEAKKWQTLLKRLESAYESDYKLAIIEADNFLDEILKRTGFPGETLGEKLRMAPPEKISHLDEIMEVHNVRNSIVHDPDYHISREQAKSVLEIYEKVFRSLDVF